MESEDETRTYTELTPVILETSQGCHTEVKFPLPPRITEATNDEATGADSYETFTAMATCNISQNDCSMHVDNRVGLQMKPTLRLKGRTKMNAMSTMIILYIMVLSRCIEDSPKRCL